MSRRKRGKSNPNRRGSTGTSTPALNQNSRSQPPVAQPSAVSEEVPKNSDNVSEGIGDDHGQVMAPVASVSSTSKPVSTDTEVSSLASSHLSHRVQELEQALAEQQSATSTAQETLQQQQALVAQLHQQLGDYQSKCQTYGAEVNAHQAKLTAKDYQIVEMQEQIGQLTQRLQQQQAVTKERDQLQATVKQQEQALAELTQQVQQQEAIAAARDVLQATVEQHQQTLADARSQIVQLQHLLERQQAEHLQAQHTVERQNQAIARLNQHLQSLQDQIQEKTSECLLRQRDYAAIAQESRQHQATIEQLQRDMAGLRSLANLAESHLNRWQARTFTRSSGF
ncbi:MAG TPA: hypothetical protein V6D20_06685 [Candidatus Obscuribacterales bacterium]